MKREELLRYAGSIQQIASARRVCYDEGRARGLHAVEVRNGPLSFTVMLDKCLDICEMSWRGQMMNFLSKPGLTGRNPFDTHGQEAQRSIMGGLFFTCGFENICAPYTDGAGKEYPMHGRMRTSPAEHVSVEAGWDRDEYEIRVSGDIREAELFGENLVLHRSIVTRLGNPKIRVEDEIRNEAFRDEPVLLMYHCNLGYPFLTEHCRVLLPTEHVTPRDSVSAAHADSWSRMDPPQDGAQEYVYLHTLRGNDQSDTFAAVVDEEKELGLVIRFNRKQLPYFGQWKSVASGDYVMGLEPGNAMVYGRAYHEKRGDLPMLGAQCARRVTLSFEIAEGMEQIQSLEQDGLLKKQSGGKMDETIGD